MPDNAKQWQDGRWKHAEGDPSKGKGTGKGKYLAPQMGSLPQPLVKPTIGVPKTLTGPSASSSNADKDLIGELLAHLGDKEDVPPALREKVNAYKEDHARAEGKLMHRQVHKQTEARTSLQKLARDRQVFLDSWAEYISGVAQMFKEQVESMQETLSQFNQAEESWTQQLQEATVSLAKHSCGSEQVPGARADESMDDEDVTIGEIAANAAKRQAQTENIRHSQTELMAALERAKEAAEGQRSSSRTPRRSQHRGSHVQEVSSSPEHPQGAGR